MKPASRPFIRRVRQQARRELKASKGAWKEYKRSRHSWRRSERVNASVSLYFIFLSAFSLLSRATPEAVGFAIALYGTGTMLRRGQTMFTLLNCALPNYFFLHHPIPDVTVFRHHMRRVFWTSTWSLLVFTVGLALFYREQALLATAWWMIAPAAIAMWLACLGGILAVARFAGVATPLNGLAFVLYAFAVGVPALPVDAISPLHHVFVVTPVGSITYFLAQHELHQEWLPVSLVPGLASIAALPWLFVQARRSYASAPQIEQLFGAQEAETVERAALTGYEEVESFPEATDADVAARFVSASLVYTGEGARWLNRLIDRWFSSRERIVYRFLCGDVSRDWVRPWERANQVAMMTLIFAIPAAVPQWMVWVPGALAVMSGLPLFGGTWPGFSDVLSSGKVSPLYAGFPITFREITTVLLKVNLVRIVAWVPGAIVVFLSVGKAFALTPGESVTAALEFLYGVTVLQLLALVFKCSAGSDDSKRWGWKRTPVVLATWALIIAFASSWWALFFADGMAKVAFAGAMPLAAILALTLYRFGYENGYWDLVKA